MKKGIGKKAVSLLLCAIMVFSTVAAGFAVTVSAASNDTWYAVHSTGTIGYKSPSAGTYIIVDSATNMALNTSLGGTDVSSSFANATHWTFTGDNGSFTINSGSNYLRKNNSNQLRNNTTNSGRNFTVEAVSEDTVYIQNSNYYLSYNGTQYTLSTEPRALKLYTYTPGQAASTNYVYQLETDGIDAGETYIIVDMDNPYALRLNTNNQIRSFDVSSYRNTNANTITIPQNTNNVTSINWVLSGTSSGSIKWANGDRYLATNTATIGTVTSKPNTNFTYKVSDSSAGKYQLYFSYNRNTYYVNNATSGGTNSYSYNTSSNTILLYKLTQTPSAAIPESTELLTFETDPNKTTYTPDLWAWLDSGCVVNIIAGDGDILVDSIKVALSSDLATDPHIYTTEIDPANDPNPMANAMTVAASNPSFSNIEFDISAVNADVSGTYTVPVRYNDVEIGSVSVVVAAEKPVTQVTLVNEEGTVYIGSDLTAKTGAYVRVHYTDGTSVLKPITLSMLSGDYDVDELDDYSNLVVTYNTNIVASDFVLHVIDLEQYPEYPEEGSVRINKTASAPHFSENGVAQVELTATGIPLMPGIDIVFVLDTSNSMTNLMGTYHNRQVYQTDSGWYYADDGTFAGNLNSGSVQNPKSRHDVLEDSLKTLIKNLETEGVNGVKRDIDVAVCDFNGYTPVIKSGTNTDKLKNINIISTQASQAKETFRSLRRRQKMKIKKELCLRNIGGDDILVPVGKTVDEYNGLFFLSPVGALVYRGINNGLNEDEILSSVLEEFEVDEKTAKNDVNAFIDQLKEFGIVE